MPGARERDHAAMLSALPVLAALSAAAALVVRLEKSPRKSTRPWSPHAKEPPTWSQTCPMRSLRYRPACAAGDLAAADAAAGRRRILVGHRLRQRRHRRCCVARASALQGDRARQHRATPERSVEVPGSVAQASPRLEDAGRRAGEGHWPFSAPCPRPYSTAAASHRSPGSLMMARAGRVKHLKFADPGAMKIARFPAPPAKGQTDHQVLFTEKDPSRTVTPPALFRSSWPRGRRAGGRARSTRRGRRLDRLSRPGLSAMGSLGRRSLLHPPPRCRHCSASRSRRSGSPDLRQELQRYVAAVVVPPAHRSTTLPYLAAMKLGARRHSGDDAADRDRSRRPLRRGAGCAMS